MNPLPEADPTRCVILRRVSSSEQASDGYGLGDQAHACRAFAKANGLEVVADFEETARSTTLIDERPGGRAALEAMMRLGAGVLLLAKRDRLVRDPFVAGHAKRAVGLMGGRILYAEGGNGAGDDDLLLGDIREAIAAHERRAIVARLRGGREQKRRQNPRAYVGGRPAFGYRADPETRELVIDTEQAAVVRRIFEDARSGRTVRQIVATLNAEKAGGRTWYPASVMRVLKHDEYRRKHPGQIIDGKVFKAAQDALSARRRR